MRPLLDLDHQLIDRTPGLEHPVLTAVFVVVSAWWVKGPLLIAVALCADAWRKRVPIAFAATGAAVLSSSLAINALKEVFDRPRPPSQDAGIAPLVPTPESASFPSGHAGSAFAAAAAIAVLCPRLRWPALGLAAAVALSRVYLRVHFPLDIAVGAAIGAALGVICAVVTVRVLRSASSPSPRLT